MGVGRKKIGENLRRVRDEIAAAAERARRRAEDVRLVVVTKAADVEDIKHLVDLGVTDLGENRVQQLLARVEEIGDWLGRKRKSPAPAVRWHMVGHLQRNKARKVIGRVAMIHSIDSLRLAEELAARAEQAERTVEVLLQVNCSEEPQKEGVAVGAAAHLAEQICTLKPLHLTGLMAMAPIARDAEKARATFVRLREIFDDMRRDKIGGKDFRHLSMGMSQDYPVAVEEGATIVRIGTAIFQ